MNEQQEMEIRLWEYIDGLCTEAEKSFVETHLASSAEWRKQYASLLSFQSTLQKDISLDEPSMRFTRNVMEEIGRFQIAPAAKSYINTKIIYGIGGFLLTLIVGFLIYAFAQVDWTAGSSVTDKLPLKLPNLQLSKALSNNYVNAFMILNMVLGLMLLDRYLGQRRKGWKNQTID